VCESLAPIQESAAMSTIALLQLIMASVWVEFLEANLILRPLHNLQSAMVQTRNFVCEFELRPCVRLTFISLC
jgi:hypothetical protein